MVIFHSYVSLPEGNIQGKWKRLLRHAQEQLLIPSFVAI
jgi:hypothetical protein